MKVSKYISLIGLATVLALPITALAEDHHGHDSHTDSHHEMHEHHAYIYHDRGYRPPRVDNYGYYHHDEHWYGGRHGYWYMDGPDWCFRGDDGYIYCRQPDGYFGWFRF